VSQNATPARRSTQGVFETPNCDRLREVQPESQLCGEFLEFLTRRFIFCMGPPLGHDGDYFRPSLVDAEKLLAEFFGVDLEGLEREKRAILESIRRK